MVKPISQEEFRLLYDDHMECGPQSGPRLLKLYEVFGTSEFTVFDVRDRIGLSYSTAQSTVKYLASKGFLIRYAPKNKKTGYPGSNCCRSMWYRVNLSIQELIENPVIPQQGTSQKPISQRAVASRFECYKARSPKSYARVLALYAKYGAFDFSIKDAAETLKISRTDVYNSFRQLVGYGILVRSVLVHQRRKRDRGLRYRIDLTSVVEKKTLARIKKVPELPTITITHRVKGQWVDASFRYFESVDGWLKRNPGVDVFFLSLDRDYASLNISTVFELNQLLRVNQCHRFNTFFDKVLQVYPNNKSLRVAKHFVSICEHVGENILTAQDMSNKLGLSVTQCNRLLDSWLRLGWVRPVEPDVVSDKHHKARHYYKINWIGRIKGAESWHERIDMKGSTLEPMSQGDLLWSLGAYEFAPFVKRIF